MNDIATQSRGLKEVAFARVRDYIDANIGEALGLERLSGVARLSRFHFARRFRASTGTSPMSYVMTRRIDSAKRVLASGGAALCDIAVNLGFYDQSHFTRTFRKATGLTPLAYARQARAARPESFIQPRGSQP